MCVARLTDDVVFGKAKRSSAADLLERSVVINKLPQFSLEPIPFPLTLCLRSRIGMYFSAINDRVPVKIFSANFGMWYNQRLLIGHLRGPAPGSVFLTSISDRLTLSAEKNANGFVALAVIFCASFNPLDPGIGPKKFGDRRMVVANQEILLGEKITAEQLALTPIPGKVFGVRICAPCLSEEIKEGNCDTEK